MNADADRTADCAHFERTRVMAQQQPHVAQYGFNAPSPAHSAARNLHHHQQHQQQPTSPANSNNVDPAILFGYSATASGMASPLAASQASAGGHGRAGAGGMYGSSSVLSDADLDFENILASLNSAAAQQHSAGALPQGYMGAPIAGLQSGANHLRHQSPLAPVNENGTQQAAGEPVEFFSQPQPPKPRRSSTHEFGTPNTNATASYGASPSDTSSKRSVSQERTGRLGRSSSASGVGKAPRQTSRSRSARRTSSAATAGYQDRTEAKERGRDRERSRQREVGDKASPASNLGTPAASAATPGASSASGSAGGGGGAAAAAAPPPPPADAADAAAAMGIPTSSAALASHPYAMSMPGFVHPATYGAHAASLPTHAGGWFPAPHPSSGAIPLGMHPHHHPAALAAAAAAAAGGGAFASPHHFMAPHPHHPMAFDPLTGWRPTVGPLPASAPPAGAPALHEGNLPAASSAAAAATTTAAAAAAASATGDGGASGPSSAGGSKKSKGLEDVLEEEDGGKRCAGMSSTRGRNPPNKRTDPPRVS